MKPKNALNRLSPLLKKTSFTAKEAEALGVSAASVAYYVRIGVLTRLRRGIYCSPNSNIDTDIAWEDLVRIIPQIPDGIVCLITALVIYGLTDEISREFWVAIPNDKRSPKIENFRIVRMRNMTLGKTKIKLGSHEITIFDEERSVIDTFRFLDKEVAIKSLKLFLAKHSDSRKLQTYAKILRVNIKPYLLTATT